jgi:hypothetical protein
MRGFDKAEKRIFKASSSFYRSLLKKELKTPGLGDMVYFASFKAFCSNASYQKVCPADDEYYRSKEYFYPILRHPFRRVMSKLVNSLMRTGLKSTLKE